MKLFVLVAFLGVAINPLGCMQKSVTIPLSASEKLIANEQTISLWCWYVEDNGAGGKGYAAKDGIISMPHPAGGGLFNSIEELRQALKDKKVKMPNIIPYFDGAVPKGWKIRSLSESEIKMIQAP